MVFCNIEVSDHFLHHHALKYTGKVPSKIACVSEELNYWISPSAKKAPNTLFWALTSVPAFEYIYVCHNWPVNKAIFNLPIRLKGASRHISGDSLKLLGLKTRVEVTNWGLITSFMLATSMRIPILLTKQKYAIVFHHWSFSWPSKSIWYSINCHHFFTQFIDGLAVCPTSPPWGPRWSESSWWGSFEKPGPKVC